MTTATVRETADRVAAEAEVRGAGAGRPPVDAGVEGMSAARFALLGIAAAAIVVAFAVVVALLEPVIL
jgi:hypothetical protein